MADKTNESPFQPYISPTAYNTSDTTLDAPNYVSEVNEKIENDEFPHANDLEEFLDSMGEKYYKNVEKTIERLFGVKDIANYDYMYRTAGKK